MSFAPELRHAGPAPSEPGPDLRSAASPRTGRRAIAAPTAHPFAKAFACAAIAYAVALLLCIALRGMASDQTLGQTFASLALASAMPAVVTGMLVRQSPRTWSFWQIALAFLPMFCLVAALQVTGALAG